jgi:hypothetical protein
MLTVVLTRDEQRLLNRQAPTTESDGGFQGLLVRLRRKLEPETGQLPLDDEELERIPRYAFDYGNGGWESRLLGIFARTLGPSLGRQRP